MSIDLRWSGIAAMTLAATVAALGQPAPAMRNTEQQAVFFSGEVTLQDGSKPPDPVLIQRVCKGATRNETWTDSKGRFSFKVEAGGSASISTPNSAEHRCESGTSVESHARYGEIAAGEQISFAVSSGDEGNVGIFAGGRARRAQDEIISRSERAGERRPKRAGPGPSGW